MKTESKPKPRIKEEVIFILQSLTHSQVGLIADNLGVEPSTVHHHIKKNTPTLTKYHWMNEIKRITGLKDVEIINTFEDESAG